MSKIILTLFLTVFALHSVHAQEGLIGFEWTFTNEDIVRNFTNTPEFPDMPPIPGRGLVGLSATTLQALQSSPHVKVIAAWLNEIKVLCPDCTIKNNKVVLPDGFWFKITLDSTVLEVLTQPMTLNQLKERSELLESLIWRSAKKAGVVPHSRLGGGHIHLDIESYFNNDRTLFRNFVVDLMNRPELFMGGLGLNYFNAPPLSFYDPKEVKGFKKIISDFDKDPSQTVQALMENINAFYETLQHPLIPTPNSKFQALNFKHLLLGLMGTLEARGVRPQVSVEHSIRLVQMFESRIAVLKKRTKLLKIKVPDLSTKYQAERIKGFRVYSHSLDPSQIMDAVQDYAKAGGLEADFYNDYVTEELKADLKIEAAQKKASGYRSAGFCGSFL